MKIHNFITSMGEDKFYKVIYCTKCGQVVWNFNWSRDLNKELQDKIKPCVESETLSAPHLTDN